MIFTVSGAHTCNIAIPSLTRRRNFRRAEIDGEVNIDNTKFNSRRTEIGGKVKVDNAKVQF